MLTALIELLIVVMPVLFKLIAPRAVPEPTAPERVISFAPALMVKFCALALLIVLLN